MLAVARVGANAGLVGRAAAPCQLSEVSPRRRESRKCMRRGVERAHYVGHTNRQGARDVHDDAMHVHLGGEGE